MSDVRNAARTDEDFPPVLFVFQGTLQQGRDILHELWPEARAVSDSSLDLYRAFGLRRGGAGKLFGPGVWLAGLRAVRKGHRIGRPVGDPWIMPGMFLVSDGRVRWSHTFRHAGDHPDLSGIAGVARRLADTPGE